MPDDPHLAICGATDIGTKRADNQDTLVIADLRSGDMSNPCSRTGIPLSKRGILFSSATGWAVPPPATSRRGLLPGDQAAAGRRGCGGAEHPNESLKSAVFGANGAVLAEAQAHPEARGMGTTCTAAIVLPDRLFVAQVGDSRAYLLRDDRLQALTRDQTMADQLLEIGALRPDAGAPPILSATSCSRPWERGRRSNRSPRRRASVGAIGSCSVGRPARPRSRPGDRPILGTAADIDSVTHDLIQAALAAGTRQRDSGRRGLRIESYAAPFGKRGTARGPSQPVRRRE